MGARWSGAVALLLMMGTARGLDNGLGLTPALGFNTWNAFHCDISEETVKGIAQALVDTGLFDAGYKFLNLDDCWENPVRGADGTISEDLTRFPSGMKALGDFLHQKGFKFGIYSSAGYKTCEGRPASLEHEASDAMTWASWGVDYLKYDNCHTDGSKPELRYPKMRDALNATGRPILYSLCEWGQDNPGAWADEVGNSWRTTPDIQDNWASMIHIVDMNARRWRYAKPGAFNDPDMLEVGNGGMTVEEYRTHMTLWSLMKSPLLVGCDLRKADNDTLSILLNRHVIAVNQDPLGQQGRRVWSDVQGWAPVEAMTAPCQGGKSAEARWAWDKPSGQLRVVSPQSMCLTAKGGSFQNFTLATVETCLGDAPAQKWTFADRRIRPAAAPHMCLEVFATNDDLSKTGVTVQLALCGSGPHQEWAMDKGALVNGWQKQCLIPDTDAPPGTLEVWAVPLSDGSVAAAMLNRGNSSATITASWSMLGLSPASSLRVLDMWAAWDGRPTRVAQGPFGLTAMQVPSHGVEYVRVTPAAKRGRLGAFRA